MDQFPISEVCHQTPARLSHLRTDDRSSTFVISSKESENTFAWNIGSVTDVCSWCWCRLSPSNGLLNWKLNIGYLVKISYWRTVWYSVFIFSTGPLLIFTFECWWDRGKTRWWAILTCRIAESSASASPFKSVCVWQGVPILFILIGQHWARPAKWPRRKILLTW